MRTALADAGDRLPPGRGELTAGPLLLSLAGLHRLGWRTVLEVEVHRATGDGGATGHGVTDAGDAVVAVLEGTGRPGLATGAGVHSLLRG